MFLLIRVRLNDLNIDLFQVREYRTVSKVSRILAVWRHHSWRVAAQL